MPKTKLESEIEKGNLILMDDNLIKNQEEHPAASFEITE